MLNNIIELNGVSKSFDKNLIIDNVDLIINKGEIVAFIGNNGTGKSTIIKMLAGLIYQDKGIIKLFGYDNHHQKIKEFCEFVFESGQGFYSYLTAYENIRYFLGLNKIKFKTVINEYKNLCNLFDFSQHLNKKVDQLSQGNRQKMALILALLNKPQVLFLDEPTNGLDRRTIDLFSDLLINQNKENNLTILLTSHDMYFLNRINARKLVVSNQRIFESLDWE